MPKLMEPLATTILNSLSAHIAILDTDGVILETNKAWRRFAAENDTAADQSIGTNYLTLCDAARGSGARDAHSVAKGIRQGMNFFMIIRVTRLPASIGTTCGRSARQRKPPSG